MPAPSSVHWGDVGKFSSWWGSVILGCLHRCVDMWLVQLQCSSLPSLKFWSWTFLNFLAWLPARLEVFILLFALMEKKDCFQFPVNVRWCINIRDIHVQNAISLVLPDISRSPRSSTGVDVPSVTSTSAL